MISWIKSLYIWLVEIVSLINFHKRRKNVVYVMSFNNVKLINKIAETIPKHHQLIVFYTQVKLNPSDAELLHSKRVRLIYFKNNLHFIFKDLPILLTAKLIICDNYFPFLAGLRLPKGVQIIQVWHADGAVKRFGWGDPDTKLRKQRDQIRFQKVYNCFDHYIVASKVMGRVFSNDYHVPLSRMELLGYPRSDQFFNRDWIRQARKNVFKKHPEFRHRRIILYAPTYRKDVTFNPPNGLERALTSDPSAIVIIRLHPALRRKFGSIKQKIGHSSRIYYLNHTSTAELLTITNTLVTDYSSVAFDYSLLPNAYSIIFFMYDLDQYQRSPGCQPCFLKWLPNPVVKNVDELAQAIRQNRSTDFQPFNLRWNTYNDGHASDRFINQYIKPLRRGN